MSESLFLLQQPGSEIHLPEPVFIPLDEHRKALKAWDDWLGEGTNSMQYLLMQLIRDAIELKDEYGQLAGQSRLPTRHEMRSRIPGYITTSDLHGFSRQLIDELREGNYELLRNTYSLQWRRRPTIFAQSQPDDPYPPIDDDVAERLTLIITGQVARLKELGAGRWELMLAEVFPLEREVDRTAVLLIDALEGLTSVDGARWFRWKPYSYQLAVLELIIPSLQLSKLGVRFLREQQQRPNSAFHLATVLNPPLSTPDMSTPISRLDQQRRSDPEIIEGHAVILNCLAQLGLYGQDQFQDHFVALCKSFIDFLFRHMSEEDRNHTGAGSVSLAQLRESEWTSFSIGQFHELLDELKDTIDQIIDDVSCTGYYTGYYFLTKAGHQNVKSLFNLLENPTSLEAHADLAVSAAKSVLAANKAHERFAKRQPPLQRGFIPPRALAFTAGAVGLYDAAMHTRDAFSAYQSEEYGLVVGHTITGAGGMASTAGSVWKAAAAWKALATGGAVAGPPGWLGLACIGIVVLGFAITQAERRRRSDPFAWFEHNHFGRNWPAPSAQLTDLSRVTFGWMRSSMASSNEPETRHLARQISEYLTLHDPILPQDGISVAWSSPVAGRKCARIQLRAHQASRASWIRIKAYENRAYSDLDAPLWRSCLIPMDQAEADDLYWAESRAHLGGPPDGPDTVRTVWFRAVGWAAEDDPLRAIHPQRAKALEIYLDDDENRANYGLPREFNGWIEVEILLMEEPEELCRLDLSKIDGISPEDILSELDAGPDVSDGVEDLFASLDCPLTAATLKVERPGVRWLIRDRRDPDKQERIFRIARRNVHGPDLVDSTDVRRPLRPVLVFYRLALHPDDMDEWPFVLRQRAQVNFNQ